MLVSRALDLSQLTATKSAFLFGPRQTGKTSLIRQTLGDAVVYDLLDSRTFLPLSQRPSLLREENHDPNVPVVIDEIQKLPALLDEVHALIEERGLRFLLTGSSARKLRRGGVNLLGGRARSRSLHPLSWSELGDQFDLKRAINRGLIPSIYLSDSPYEDLAAYVGDYLQSEIAAEGLTRNLPAFSRFLEEAARHHAGFVNYTSISNHAHVPVSTVREYFLLLVDTLIAVTVPALRTKRRPPLTSPKFYLFDLGVANQLLHRHGVRARSPEFGACFESFIRQELTCYLAYRHPLGQLHHWRSRSGFEVDFILDERVAIEVKAREEVTDRDLRGLEALDEEGFLTRRIVVSLAQRPRQVGGVEILPWQRFLEELWRGDVVE